MTITILCVIFFVIGACKGLQDSIEFHDTFSHWTHKWQQASWKDKKNIFGFSPNWWHRFDITRNTLSFIAVGVVIFFPVQWTWWGLLIPAAFQIGFEIAYKYKP